MDIVNKARTVYNFKNTCHNCFNDIGFPRPGDFSYGELIFQTKDGQDFRIAELIDNKTFDFITTTLKSDKELKHKKEDAQKILV